MLLQPFQHGRRLNPNDPAHPEDAGAILVGDPLPHRPGVYLQEIRHLLDRPHRRLIRFGVCFRFHFFSPPLPTISVAILIKKIRSVSLFAAAQVQQAAVVLGEFAVDDLKPHPSVNA